MPSKRGRRVQLRLPDDLYARMEAVSEATGATHSWLIRSALEEWLANWQGQVPPPNDERTSS